MPNYDIAFYGAVSFVAGTLAAGLSLTAVQAVLFLSAVVIASFIAAWRDKRTAVFIVFLFIFGVFYSVVFFDMKESGTNIPFGKDTVLTGVVSSEPQPSERFQRFNVDLSLPYSGEISVIAPLSPEMEYGNTVEISGKVEKATAYGGEPSSFFPGIKVTGEHNGSVFKEDLIGFKRSVIAQFGRFLPADSAALLGGLTLGWRGGFTDEFKKEMSLSGTTHMVALSGYNITILVLAVAGMFGFWLSRRATFWLTSVTIVLFIMMVGAEASVVRAAIMGFLALLAKEAGRRYSVRNAVVLTAAAMAIADPSVIFNIGFQLSFASLIGIIRLEPALTRLFRLENKGKSFMSWRENAVTTMSAQLAVAPLLIMTFGNFSLVGIFANVLILEFVPLAMLLGFVIALCGWMFHYAAFIVSVPEKMILEYMLAVIRFFAGISAPVSSRLGSWIFATVYYCALILFAGRHRITKDKALL